VTDTDEALEWDGENRLTGMWRGRWKEELAQVPFESLVGEAVEGSVVWRWGYDHRSRRVQRDEPGSGGERLRTVTVFAGGTSAAEYTAAAGSAWTVPLAPTVQHVRGPDLGGGTKGLLYSLRNGLPTFNRYNGRGDVVAQSDIDGTTTWAASYQADGRRTSEAGTNVERHRANTKEEDPTGLLNEGFRYRDMETGTFISRDPLGLVDGPNVYCYVRQNPWTMWDPEGLWGIGDSNGPVLDYLWDLGGGVVDGGIEAVEGMAHAVAHPINTATAVKDGVLAVKDGIGELSSALDAGHVTWGEIGTAYGDGLTEVASDPAKVGKIVGSSAVSLGAGKAAAVGGKLAMAAAVQTNTARTIAVSAVLATTELAPVASGAARGGAIAAKVGTGFANGAKQAAKTTSHKNSLDYVGETHVYRIKGPDGSTYKIGESAQGTRVRDGASIRAERQARALRKETGDTYTTQIRKTFPDKASARDYETRVIERFRRMYGDDTLPGNKTNR
jgi:RHS repeat-associated protein